MRSERMTLEIKILTSIRRIIRAVDLQSRKLLSHCGLTGPQLATLDMASELSPVSIGALARALQLGNSTVTGIVTRLESRGLLLRERGEIDRRVVQVKVTEEGRQILKDAPPLLQDRFRADLSRMEEWEQYQFLSTLERIASMMNAEELDASPHLISDVVNLDAGAEPVEGAPED